MPAAPARLVVLVSGAGTNLQALLDAGRAEEHAARVVAVGADRPGIEALARAEQAGVPTFVHGVGDFASRHEWDVALAGSVASYLPDLVVLAGFMRLTGPAFLERFGGRALNTHPSLLPAFPGMHAPRDALEHGVKVSGATLFLLDAGVDTGPIVAQVPVEVRDDDTAETLHERIKQAERVMLVQTVERMARGGYTVCGRTVRVGA